MKISITSVLCSLIFLAGCSRSSDHDDEKEIDVSEGQSNWTKVSYADLSEDIAWVPYYDGIGVNDIAIRGNTIFMAVTQTPEEISGKLYRSADKGKTWELVAGLSCGTGNELFSVSVPSANTIYTFGDCFGSKLLKSEDGGNTFIQMNVPAEMFFPIRNPPRPMHFVNENRGIILDHMTNDGGDTWTAIPDLAALNDRVLSFSFINTTSGFCNTATTVLKTEDSGDSWTVVHENPNEDFWNVYFVDESIGFVSNNSTLLKTIDGGESWTSVLEIKIHDISFVNDQVGFAVGKDGIYKSIDQGTSWNLNYSSNFLDYRGFVIPADSLRGFRSIEFDGADFGIAGGYQNRPGNIPNEKAYIAITTSLGE